MDVWNVLQIKHFHGIVWVFVLKKIIPYSDLSVPHVSASWYYLLHRIELTTYVNTIG